MHLYILINIPCLPICFIFFYIFRRWIFKRQSLPDNACSHEMGVEYGSIVCVAIGINVVVAFVSLKSVKSCRHDISLQSKKNHFCQDLLTQTHFLSLQKPPFGLKPSRL